MAEMPKNVEVTFKVDGTDFKPASEVLIHHFEIQKLKRMFRNLLISHFFMSIALIAHITDHVLL